MHIRNIYVTLAYKALLIAVCACGLYIETGLTHGRIDWSIFNYYTIISNLICLVYFIFAFAANIVSALKGNGPVTFAPRIKGAVVLCITATLLIYQLVLAPTPFSMGTGASLGNTLVHLVVPLMAILDWLLFDSKGNYKKYDPVLWLVTPAAYFAYIIVRAQFWGPIRGIAGKYPYGFIDIDHFGLKQVLINIGEFAFFFLVIGYAFYFTDKALRVRPLR